MRQTSYTSVAAETPEASSTTTGTKAEATLPFEAVSSPVESIPSWVPVTTRAAGTEGYDESVEYVAGLLEDAGYEVTLDPVQITFNFPATLRQLTPVEAEYETGVYTGSGSGTVQGQVIPVDINLTGDRASTSCCEAADFAGIDWSDDADIALIQRGTCFSSAPRRFTPSRRALRP
jgi:hypothetical protein